MVNINEVNINDGTIRVGESFVEPGANAAHINVMLGSNEALGNAWSIALGTPRLGHGPFMGVLEPNRPIKPATVIVTKAAIQDDEHGLLLWGPAQAGIARGVTRAIDEGLFSADAADDALLICAVWVNPAADDADAVFRNNEKSTFEALRNAVLGLHLASENVSAIDNIHNPFYDPRATSISSSEIKDQPVSEIKDRSSSEIKDQ